MFERVLEIYPEASLPNLANWADTVRLMRERDGRSDDEIRELFAWASRDSFWQLNIRSPNKLREKWEDLDIRRRSQSREPASRVATNEELANWRP